MISLTAPIPAGTLPNQEATPAIMIRYRTHPLCRTTNRSTIRLFRLRSFGPRINCGRPRNLLRVFGGLVVRPWRVPFQEALNMIRVMLFSLLFVVVAAAAAETARAETINIKFGANVYAGAGVIGSGTYWNYFSGTGTSASGSLLESSGAATSLSLTATYNNRFFGDTVVGSSPAKLLGSGLYGPFTFTITGLNPMVSYNVYTFLYDKAGHSTTTTITGSNSLAQTPTNTAILTYFSEGENYLLFSNITSSSGGAITGVSDVAWGGLNGIQISPVPEPTSLLLVAIGLLLLVVLRGCKCMAVNHPLSACNASDRL